MNPEAGDPEVLSSAEMEAGEAASSSAAGEDAGHHDPPPDVVPSVPSQEDAMVTSAIISVDDIEDSNDVNKDNVAVSEANNANEAGSGADNGDSKSGADPTLSPSPGSDKSPQLTPPGPRVTLPRIQISPEAATTSGSEDGERRLSGGGPSLSPSRIPSRKSSAAASSSQATQSQAINEDLRRLETRLERFVSKSSEGSECSGDSDQSGRSPASAVASRLHSSATASSRAKTSDKSSSGSGSGSGSGNTSPQEKTTSMLKNTLRKMTRFSIGGGTRRKDSGEDGNFAKPAPPPDTADPKSRSRAPFLGKSRVPKSQSPAPGATVNRSKSFKEPGGGSGVPRPGGGAGAGMARNNVYTSSLRRTKIKHQNQDSEERDASGRPTTAPLGRSGTGGLERGAMRRSVSASRGGGHVMSSSMHGGQTSSGANTGTNTAAKLVKKSRPVQTSLTKDPCHDTPDTDNPGLVNFQVWLPELLGGDGCDNVETQVTDFSEPVDVRKNRALTLENMKLAREVERLRGFQGDNDLLKKEVKTLKVKLEEEQKCRSKIQTDLEQYQDRVRTCMESMDCVERQFESRDLALQQMEGEQARMEDLGLQLRTRLGQAEQVIGGQKRELERSLAAQKTLIQQLQESEQEAREMQEFLQAEKGTLQEALREGEQEVRRLQEQVRGLEGKVGTMEDHAKAAAKHLETKHCELAAVRSEVGAVKERAREMLLGQGAELSRASVAIMALTHRLETLVRGDSGDSGEDTEPDSCGEAAPAPMDMSTLASSQQLVRRSSQFLITPSTDMDKTELLSEFSRAMMTTSTGSGDMKQLLSSSCDQLEAAGGAVPGLTEQINNIEELVARLAQVRTQEEADLKRSQHEENVMNGNTETETETQLREVISDKERAMAEMVAKFGRNRQILTSNWEQAECEVRRLDDIYHDTVSRVVGCLAALPELTAQHPALSALCSQLELESSQVASTAPLAANTNTNLNTDTRMSRSLVNNSLSSSGDAEVTNFMSQSQILTNSSSGTKGGLLTQSIMSDPGLVKAAPPLTPPHLSREDMNANQSL